MQRFFGVFSDFLHYQADRFFEFSQDRFFTLILCILAFILLLGYSHCVSSHRGKRLFWIGVGVFICGMALTVSIYLRRLPPGLTGHYYATPSWVDDGTELDRYFETGKNGQRVDRFIDFNPNDFTARYPFSGHPFSIQWQGYVYIPNDQYQLSVNSNFGTWLYVDDTLIQGHHRIDFGTPGARKFLREGWSYDEQWGGDASVNFVWSSGPRSEFYLGVDELADYDLSFRCIPFVYKGSSQQHMTVSVNGVVVDTIPLKNEWTTYTVPVPASVLKGVAPGFFRVRFSYSHTIQPSEVIAQSNEKRQLAVAFDVAVMQKVTEQENLLVLAQEFHKPNYLSQGFHSVTLKALQKTWLNPYIQLVWQPNTRSQSRIIPEDYLFPATGVSEGIQRGFVRERRLLGGLILYKLLGIVFLGALILRYIVPHFLRKWGRREYLIIFLIVLFAFGVRVLFLLERNSFDPAGIRLATPGTDQLNYVFYARGFLRGYWPNLYHQPFYFQGITNWSYFIICFILFGESLLTLRMVTAMLAAFSVLFTYLIALRTFNRPVAYIAALLCACNGVQIFYDTSLIVAPLKTFLGLVCLWLLLILKDQVSFRNSILLGAVLGLNALARATIFLFMPFVLLWLFIGCQGTIRRKIAHFILICTVMFATISPVTIRNYFSTESHPFVLVTTGDFGINFWISNNPLSTGSHSLPSAFLRETQKKISATGTSYVREVLGYIREDPWWYLTLESRKLKYFWRGYEIANLVTYYVFRYHSSVLKFPWINFVLIGPLAIIGMILAIRSWRKVFIPYAFVVMQLGLTLLFFALARYRIPVVPVLSIFAAYTIWYWIQRVQKKQWYRLGITMGVFIALYFILNYPDAAHLYQQRYGEAMPFFRSFRYWDIFHTW